MLDLRPYGALNPLPSSGGQLENSDYASGIGKREVEIDIVNSPAIDSAGEVFTDSTKKKLAIIISRLMEGDDCEALRREYRSELVEEAIRELENRIVNEFVLFWSSSVSVEASDGRLVVEPCTTSEGATFITADVATSSRASAVPWEEFNSSVLEGAASGGI